MTALCRHNGGGCAPTCKGDNYIVQHVLPPDVCTGVQHVQADLKALVQLAVSAKQPKSAEACGYP